uniref:40S ribosomal protein S26 n=1 Tax=Lotharella globosa TaxID=91324 RepID=A0A6V3NM83_9EUKA|mmetsp:Transcript_27500/g.53421  ORF Transcript_27500/g.53421 Transcript_27500/m.53421 type:complete len:113 (+) Transcript_27500:23-361(+)|eukprot:CAMPEP_0170173548 /NCGR_PEP_ID=MMETSP0040_2-20121228/6838_1 /TAXON_ID=641309 /ORGANISM="Lotharella oceanica, Strain CCMP622" /LENGTH=112 /DNA_ID=CAMNT_0010414783 /DNA_START=100 /DNA_END=438 /DNA_ORIENTATION=+
MPKKRRNRGRAKKNAGRKRRVACELSGKLVPKDKAIKRYIVRNIVNSAAISDLKEASVYDEYALPKLYYKMYYCVGSACHRRIVRSRSKVEMKNRTPPQRPGRRFKDGKKQS